MTASCRSVTCNSVAVYSQTSREWLNRMCSLRGAWVTFTIEFIRLIVTIYSELKCVRRNCIGCEIFAKIWHKPFTFKDTSFSNFYRVLIKVYENIVQENIKKKFFLTHSTWFLLAIFNISNTKRIIFHVIKFYSMFIIMRATYFNYLFQFKSN